MVKCSMGENTRDEAADGPVVSAGGRSPSTLSPGQGARLAGSGTTLSPLGAGRGGGGRRGASTSPLSPGPGARWAGSGTTLSPLAPGQRWSVTRKREVVLRLMRGESAELLSRELGLPVFKLEQWRQKAEAALEGALKEREAGRADGHPSPPAPPPVRCSSWSSGGRSPKPRSRAR